MRAAAVLLLATVALLAARAGLPPAAQAQAPPVAVRIEADRQRVTVGDRITLEMVVTYGEGTSLDLPGPGDDFGDLVVLEARPPQQRDLGGGRFETRLTFVVAAFRTGPLRLPPLPVAYTGPAGIEGLASTPPLSITVASVIPATDSAQDIRDLKPQLSVPGGTPVWVVPLLTAVAVLVALLLLAAVAWWARRLWGRPAVAGPAPLPEDVARRDLDSIASRALAAKGDYKAQYHLISACLRRYVSDRYAFPAFAYTTGEMDLRMVGRGVDRWQARLIAALLQECDRVQFGQYEPATARAESDLTAAYEVVEMTRPEPAEAGAAREGAPP